MTDSLGTIRMGVTRELGAVACGRAYEMGTLDGSGLGPPPDLSGAYVPPPVTAGLIADWDPSVLSSLFQDEAATIPVASAGDPIGYVEDLSGNGNHFTQATTASRFAYDITSLALPGMRADGVDDMLRRTFPGTQNVGTVFVVFAYDLATWDSYDGLLTGLNADGPSHILLGNAGAKTFAPSGTLRWFVNDGAANEPVPDLQIANIVAADYGGSNVQPNDGLQIGRDRTFVVRSLQGVYGRVLAYDRVLSDAERSSMFADLRPKWGTP